MTEMPVRETVHRHRCRCIVLPDAPDVPAWMIVDRCPQFVENPDQPVCDDCEEDHQPGEVYGIAPMEVKR